MPICHGCHGRIGDNQHQGSAIGKALCILPHSFYCRGGVFEDVSWRACPDSYVFDPNVDLASGPGFENTLQVTNFLPSSNVQNGPAFSTPLVQDDQQQYGPEMLSAHGGTGPQDQVSLGAVSRGDRFPGMIHMENSRRTLSTEFPQATVPPVPENIQDNINHLRSSNQAAGSDVDTPADFNITHLRSDPALQVGVATAIEYLVRQIIPSLSAASSATMPPGTGQASGAAGQASDQTFQQQLGAGPLPAPVAPHIQAVLQPTPANTVHQSVHQSGQPQVVTQPQGFQQQPSPLGAAAGQQQQLLGQQLAPVQGHLYQQAQLSPRAASPVQPGQQQPIQQPSHYQVLAASPHNSVQNIECKFITTSQTSTSVYTATWC